MNVTHLNLMIFIKIITLNQHTMLTIIAAAAENNALGKDNDLVWHLPDDFKRFIKNEGIGGDVDWGIEKWDIYSDQDHGIKDKFDGYLFFIGPDEHGDLDRGELQVILTKDQIKPYISNIIDWYKNIPNSNVDEFIELVQENGFL